MQVRDALEYAIEHIPPADARSLLIHTLGIDGAHLIAMYRDIISDEVFREYKSLVHRRSSGEPVAQIEGRREFYGLDFIITPDVLIPRQETELLVDTALGLIKNDTHTKVLDLCTGSGCVGIAIGRMRADAHVTLCDVSQNALDIARKNADKHRVQCCFILGDVNTMDVPREQFDVIVSNPPYIKTRDIPLLDIQVRDFEPYIALWGGDDGLDFYSVIASRFFEAIKPGGHLIFETGDLLGGADICTSIRDILTEVGYKDIEMIKDYSGHFRIVFGVKPSN